MNKAKTGTRPIFAHGPLGRRHLKEVLGAQLAGLIISPQPIWIVSPWISDFDLLENVTGEWETVQPSWGLKVVRFSELLIDCVGSGCDLKIVTKEDKSNRSFLTRLNDRLSNSTRYHVGISDDLHIKGLLTRDWYLSGSMNFTFSGATRNDEQIHLISDADILSETKLEFESRYGFLFI